MNEKNMKDKSEGIKELCEKKTKFIKALNSTLVFVLASTFLVARLLFDLLLEFL